MTSKHIKGDPKEVTLKFSINRTTLKFCLSKQEI